MAGGRLALMDSKSFASCGLDFLSRWQRVSSAIPNMSSNKYVVQAACPASEGALLLKIAISTELGYAHQLQIWQPYSSAAGSQLRPSSSALQDPIRPIITMGYANHKVAVMGLAASPYPTLYSIEAFCENSWLIIGYLPIFYRIHSSPTMVELHGCLYALLSGVDDVLVLLKIDCNCSLPQIEFHVIQIFGSPCPKHSDARHNPTLVTALGTLFLVEVSPHTHTLLIYMYCEDGNWEKQPFSTQIPKYSIVVGVGNCIVFYLGEGDTIVFNLATHIWTSLPYLPNTTPDLVASSLVEES